MIKARVSLSRRLAQLRIRHLTLLDLIAEGGSLSKVAKVLHVTQPAVTAMLQEMESALGVQLVTRDRQGARLTPVGIETQTRLRLALNILNGLEARSGMAPLVHHLRVGVLTNAMLDLVPKAVAKLRTEGAKITFQFTENTVANVIVGVLEGSFDCAIGRIGSGILNSQEGGRLAISQIQKVPLKVVCSPEHPIGRRRHISLEVLQEYSWVLLPRGSQSREAFDQAFIEHGLVPPLPIVESLSFYSNFALTNRTDLLTIVPENALEHFSMASIVRPIKYIWPVTLPPLMFFCLSEMSDIVAIAAFRQAILSE